MKALTTIFLLFVFHFVGLSQNIRFEPSFAAIRVSNIDSSMHWYSKILDLKLRNRVDNAERGFKQAVLIDSGIMIELVELTKAVSADTLLKTRPTGTSLLGYYKFGFTVPQIESAFQKFSSMQIKFHGRMVTDPVNNKKTFIIVDPDGNLIQFFEQ